MNIFKSLGVLLVLSFLVSGYCDYEDNFQINEIYLNNIYPELGETINLKILIESEEFLTSDLRIFFDEGFFTQLLIEDEIYISKGENVLSYDIKVPETMGHHIGFVDVEIGNKIETLPLIVENKYSEIIVEYYNEENYTLSIESERNIRFRIFTNIEREINVRSVNGTVNLTISRCNDCEMLISFEYMNEKFNIYNQFGNYVKPYVRISKIENNEIEFESCPPKQIEKRTYESGYERMFVEGREFDLSRFITEETNEIQVINKQPLVLRIKASDELNRNVRSEGDLFLECDTNNFFKEIEFFGEGEFTFDLRSNATCNVSYGNVMVSTEVLARERIIPEERQEVIFWDDYITYGLILLAVIVMAVLFNKWRRINKG